MFSRARRVPWLLLLCTAPSCGAGADVDCGTMVSGTVTISSGVALADYTRFEVVLRDDPDGTLVLTVDEALALHASCVYPLEPGRFELDYACSRLGQTSRALVIGRLIPSSCTTARPLWTVTDVELPLAGGDDECRYGPVTGVGLTIAE